MSRRPFSGRPHGRPEKAKMNPKAILLIGKSLKKYIPTFIIAAILLIGSIVCALLAPEYLAGITDELANAAKESREVEMETISRNGFALVAIYSASAVSHYVSAMLMTTVTQRYSQSLRRQITSKINRMPLAYFDGHPFGETLSTITNDVDQMSQSIESGFASVVQALFMLIAVVIVMFVHSWEMTLTAMISLPLMIISIFFISKMAMPRFKARQDGLASLEGVAEEIYSGLEVINVFQAQDVKNTQFDEKNNKQIRMTIAAQICGGLFGPMNNFVSYFAYAAVLLAGGLLIAKNDPRVTYGTLTAFLVYVRLFQQPLTNIGQSMNALEMAGAAAERVFNFLAEDELSDETGKPRLLVKDGLESVTGKVDFVNVNFSYDSSRVIIPDFSAWVDPGTKVAIIGPTGAGKTTMVNLLMRFYEIDGGSITIDDTPISSMPREEIRDIFGMVLQDTWIFQGTLRENLVYNSKWVTEERINEVIDAANLRHLVDTLPGGLDYYIADENSLSGGQKQLITIARAMIKNAPLLILDEATSNVDTRTEELIQESMDRLTKGRTSFVIAHRLSTIRNADLILVMENGNVVEKGTHDSLMAKNGVYAKLYNAQFSL